LLCKNQTPSAFRCVFLWFATTESWGLHAERPLFEAAKANFQGKSAALFAEFEATFEAIASEIKVGSARVYPRKCPQSAAASAVAVHLMTDHPICPLLPSNLAEKPFGISKSNWPSFSSPRLRRRRGQLL